MTDISALEAYVGQIAEAAAISGAASGKQHEYIHGDDQTDVVTESGPVPSIAKQARVSEERTAGLERRLANPEDPYEGAGILGRSVVSVDCIADLMLCPRRRDLRYSVKGYYAATDVGGGSDFYWDPSSTGSTDGGTVFAVPGIPVGRFKRGGVKGSILVDDFGAVPGSIVSQRLAIEAADKAAIAIGATLSFRGGVTYYADELFIKSRVVLGNNTKLIKASTTSRGFFNWGNKSTDMVDGFLRGFYIDANGKDNVVNFRMYGNHLRPRVRSLVLKDSDFYAFSIGGLQGQGDKADTINGLDIDGVHIESERGSVALGTDYSFGFEFFPGVICKNWRIRNANTYGKIMNKFHLVDFLDIDNVNFKVSKEFNSLSSGYCEFNNCANVIIGNNAVFDSGNSQTYFALKIGGDRVAGGQEVTSFSMSGKVKGRMGIAKVLDVQMTGDFRCENAVSIYGDCDRIGFGAARIHSLNAHPGPTSTINRVELNGTEIEGGVRFEQENMVVKEFIMTGGSMDISISQVRFVGVEHAMINATTINLRGPQLEYAILARRSKVTLNNIVMDGGGTWARPVYAADAVSAVKMIRCTLDRMLSSGLLASGSHPLVTSIGNVVNGVAA